MVQWQNDHHWLGTEPADGKTRLFCTICRSHGKVARGGNITRAWIDGTFRHKLSGVNDHEGSKLHHDSVVTAQIAAGVAEKGGGSLPAMQVRASLQQHKTRDVAILKLIKGLYWIAKEDVALQKWQSLTMDLFEEIGVNVSAAEYLQIYLHMYLALSTLVMLYSYNQLAKLVPYMCWLHLLCIASPS